ncbi:uncharacterized protein VICG_00341 [Vittaforma corneae ATCC 50505]|uniref:Uncharacterized protein n=1 Tax=Vittaforma corneae (strain ATCC 50505) TaxID=993615 RepID=L2GPS8_VITCO|nr:uncharacterized protein VICG_00341 [Vittaforma corneae ATCC 50505]ELA42589.1 hypothetical protein VICG_00341 [Vittaforma corneae ATCC 50505]
MEDELLKRIKELEDENTFLNERLRTLEKVRTPLSTIPVQKQPAPSTVSMQQPVHDLEVDNSLLYYLKSILGYSIKYNKNTIVLKSVYALVLKTPLKLWFRTINYSSKTQSISENGVS